jgi:hypothetical protein
MRIAIHPHHGRIAMPHQPCRSIVHAFAGAAALGEPLLAAAPRPAVPTGGASN